MVSGFYFTDGKLHVLIRKEQKDPPVLIYKGTNPIIEGWMP
jgi:hypothetical protein